MGTSLEEMEKNRYKNFPHEKTDHSILAMEKIINSIPAQVKSKLYSVDFAAEGFDPMPVLYTHILNHPQDFYRLIYGRAPMHTFSRTIKQSQFYGI